MYLCVILYITVLYFMCSNCVIIDAYLHVYIYKNMCLYMDCWFHSTE